MLQELANWVTAVLLGLTEGSPLEKSVNFFVYDSVKIMALLALMTFGMSWLRYYLPVETLRDWLSKHKLFGLDYFAAALFGAITPFCSCSSIPLFIGFLGAGIPLGVTFTFLITSPLINELAVALMIGLFGWKITGIYVTAGLLMGILGGYLISRLKMERYVESFIKNKDKGNRQTAEIKKFSRKVLISVFHEAWCITKQVTPYVLAGVAIGSIIHGFVPLGFFEKYVSIDNPLAVPIAVLIGVPSYASAHSVIPIIQPLVDKGVPIGTALAFMMATVALSLPEALMLKKVIKLPLLLTFFGVVSAGIIIIGYTLNAVL